MHVGYLLVEDGLCLAAEARLLAVVAALALGVERGLACFVLRHLVQCVPPTLGRAQRLARLGYVHLHPHAHRVRVCVCVCVCATWEE